MKIAFCNPPWWEATGKGLRYGIRAGSRWPFTVQAHCKPDEFSFGGYLPFPFFMSYAASYAQREFPEANVILRDSIAMRESYESFLVWITTEMPEYVVIESATPSWDHDSRMCRYITSLHPSVKIIITGTITTTRAQEALSIRGVVAAVKGEYEKGVVRVLRGETGIIDHDLLTVAEMNEAPFPMLQAEAATNYWDACPKGQIAPQLQVWSSRGCPFRCSFCAWPATMTGNDPDGTGRRAVRNYSPEHMAEQIARAIYAHGYKSLYDDSDTFNLQERHTIDMCAVYRKTGLPWSAMCRADTISRETWQLMKDSGCFGVKIGFESGSQRVIDSIINKRLNLKEAADTARYLRSIGLTVHGTFSIGHPGETPAEAQQTIDLIHDLYASGGLDTHQLSGTAVIEGTPLDTIEHGAHLKAYDAAVIDENYVRFTDGQMKIERMLNK